MKVAIITLTDGANYGNRLQNYAMQQLLSTFGHDVETLKRKTYRDKSFLERIEWYIKDNIKFIIGRSGTKCLSQKRLFRFRRFNKKYIRFANIILSNNIAPEGIGDKYDYFVCGSDQIWNTYFSEAGDDIMNQLAYFARPSQRIAYAASFGANTIESEYSDMFSIELSKFKAIGMREEDGVRIVEELTGRTDIHVVCDPTMMLSNDEWIEIEKKPKYVNQNEKFIVTYFIGSRTKEIAQHINNLSRQYGLRTINLDMEYVTDKKIDKPVEFLTTPDEFVWLIHNAEFVITDSFHASVFSILFQKRFLVYSRIPSGENNMNGRIETLLSMFSIEECWDDIENPTKTPPNIDYQKISNMIEDYKNKSRVFLEKAFSD